MTNRALRTGVGSQWPHSDAQKKTTTTIAYGLTLLDLINTALKSVGVHCAEEKLRRAMILGWRNIPITLIDLRKGEQTAQAGENAWLQ